MKKKSPGTSPKLAIAKGPANVFSGVEDKKRHAIFANWKKRAVLEEEDDEHTDTEFCSRYRRLIAYYLPIDELNKVDDQNHYDINKIRRYLASRLSDAEDPLDHALRIKFAIASRNHVEAMRLIKQSSLNLNLSCADLSSELYLFDDIDLSNACLENTILNVRFFIAESGVLGGPKCLNGANLKNALCEPEYHHDWLFQYLKNTNTPSKKHFFEKLAKASGGLDVRFGEIRKTMLHIYARSTNDNSIHDILILLRYGASTRIVDSNGNRPFSMVARTTGFFPITMFDWEPVKHIPLLASLTNDELKEEKGKYHIHRVKMVLDSILLLFMAATGVALLMCMFSAPNLYSSVEFLCLLVMGAGTAFPCLFYVPEVLLSIFFDYKEIQQAIDLQCLAKNDPNYKIHLLLQKKFLLHENKLSEDLLTPEEELLFSSLTKKQLREQLALNNTMTQQGIADGKTTIIKGFIFAAIAIASAAIPFVAPALLPFVSSTITVSFFSSLFYLAARLSINAIFRGISSIRKANEAEDYINQMITTELTKRPDDKDEPAPAKTLEHKHTLTPVARPATTLVAEAKVGEVSLQTEVSPQTHHKISIF